MNELIEKTLAKVRSALRISRTTIYDDELKSYIRFVVDDLNALGIDLLEQDDESLFASFESLSVIYCKSLFGLDSGGKDVWKQMYEDLKRQVVVRCKK